MKINVFKTMVAAVCVVATGMVGLKAYNGSNQPKTTMILSENVEALSQSENQIPCYFAAGECIFNATANGQSGTATVKGMVHI